MFAGEFQLIFPVVQYKITLHADDTCICSSKNKPLSSLGLFYCFIAFHFTVTNNGHYFTDIISHTGISFRHVRDLTTVLS